MKIRMINPKTGEVKTGFCGYSWTSLFFGPFPALFRLDVKTFVVYFCIWCFFLAIIPQIIWSFLYNKYYTKKLIEEGFVFDDTPQKTASAKKYLGIIDTGT